jgi:hypothetical protein
MQTSHVTNCDHLHRCNCLSISSFIQASSPIHHDKGSLPYLNPHQCRGTSVHFLTSPPLSSPTLPLFICISPTPLYYHQGPYLKFDDSRIRRSNDFLDVDSPNIIDFLLLPLLRRASDALGQVRCSVYRSFRISKIN